MRTHNDINAPLLPPFVGTIQRHVPVFTSVLAVSALFPKVLQYGVPPQYHRYEPIVQAYKLVPDNVSFAE